MKEKNKRNNALLIIEKTATALLIVIVIIIVFDLNPNTSSITPKIPHPTLAPLITTTPFRPSDIPDYGNPPTLSLAKRRNNLDCSLITEVRYGPSWNGLQIGITTYEEMREILAPTLVWWNGHYGHLYFEEYRPALEKEWGSFRTCFVGDRLSAMQFYDRSTFPITRKELISTYGKPDRVTWAHYYHNRILIWAERGIAVELDLATEGDKTAGILMFSPIPLEELEKSWLMQSLPKEGLGFPVTDDGYYGQLPPELEVEDPWGYNK